MKRKQAALQFRVDARAVFARFKSLDIIDSPALVFTVSGDDQIAANIGERCNPLTEPLPQPLSAGGGILGNFFFVPMIIRQPLVKLRPVAIEHLHGSLDYRLDIDHHRG